MIAWALAVIFSGFIDGTDVAAVAAAHGKCASSFSWTANPEPDLAGYRVHYGPRSGVYVGYEATTETSINLIYPPGMRYFAATAVNTAGVESGYSKEVFYECK